MSSSRKSLQGIVLILISTVMFGSYGVWSRLIGDSFGVFFQGWTRALIILVLITPILAYKKQIIRIHRQDWKWLFIFLIFTSATQAPIFYAFNNMDIGSATLIFFTTMLLTMYAIGFIFHKEKASLIKIISFILALGGLYFLFSFSLEKFAVLAASMAVLNGIASGGEVAFSKKLSGDYPPLYLTWLSWLIILPSNAILSFFLAETQILPTLNIVWLWQLGYVVASLFAFWLVIAGLKYVEASIGGLIGLLEIIFSIIFGIVIFHEVLSPRILIGGVLILLAASAPHLSSLIITRKTQNQRSKKNLNKRL